MLEVIVASRIGLPNQKTLFGLVSYHRPFTGTHDRIMQPANSV